LPDLDGVTRCSWCEDSLYPDDPDFTDCWLTGESHLACHVLRCYCAELGLATA